jgi:type I restriction enzyme M protein
MMACIAGVTLNDVVLDPTCGTGGFLIAAAHQVQAHEISEGNPISWEKTINQIKDNLLGFESEPVTAALCVVNMVRDTISSLSSVLAWLRNV